MRFFASAVFLITCVGFARQPALAQDSSAASGPDVAFDADAQRPAIVALYLATLESLESLRLGGNVWNCSAPDYSG